MNVKITDNSDKIKAELAARTDAILEALGMTAEGYAKENCPVDTGRLRNSITHKADGNTAYIGTNVEYAPDVELFDRSHRTGKAHFMRDAVQNHTDEYRSIIADGLSGIGS